MGKQTAGFGDWNDLHCQQGADAVRAQLTAALAAANSPAPTLPEATPTGATENSEGDSLDLAACLKRFVWTTPDGKVYDSIKVAILKKNQLADWIGKDVFKEWMASPERRTMEHRHALRNTRAAAGQGGVGDSELEAALQRFVLLYPSQQVWDKERCEMVRLEDIKVLLNRNYTPWCEHSQRQVADYKKVVFDPTQRKSAEDGYINMFRGLPMRPIHAPDKCMAIRRLLDRLVNSEAKVFDWLMSWLAYPLQNVGAKMATMVLMHAEMQGGGKSLFFEDCYKPIFGEYASTVGQTQMESQYTDWRSKMLFGLFEEVLSRSQKFNHVGAIKHMVSGKTMRVEKKFVSGWEEDNHMNFVFLSNEMQPVYIEPFDRRTLVVSPNDKLPPDLRDAVLHELANDGVAAFYGYLLRWKMPTFTDRDGIDRPFHTHTEPPMTAAKESIIEFGLPGWEHFLKEWQNGELELPHQTCLSTQLYDLYNKWCSQVHERPLTLHKFSLLINNRIERRKDRSFYQGVKPKKGSFFWIDQPPTGKKQEDWLTERVKHWESKLNSMTKGYGND